MGGKRTVSQCPLILAIIGGAVAVTAMTLGNSISVAMNRAASNLEHCGGGC
jgi:hypothetical protein